VSAATEREHRDFIAAFDRDWREMGDAPRDADWRASVSIWAQRGLELPELLAHAGNAQDRERPWKYLCATVWAVLRKRDAERGT
jgi:hypothetical protein